MTHNKRKPIEQNLHDTMVSLLSKTLEANGKIVRNNIGETKLNGVTNEGKDKSYYPDVFVHVGKKVTEIYEIETESTVNEDSIDQWKQASTDNAKFFLIVPRKSLKVAKELVKKHKIPVKEYFVF